MTRRLTLRGQRGHDDLVGQALACFCARGYDNTTVADLVDALDIRPTTFSWYFASAESCFRRVLTMIFDDRRQHLQATVAIASDPLRRIQQGIRAQVLWAATHLDEQQLVDWARLDARFSALVHAGDAQALADALPSLRAGIDAGLLRDDDPVALAHAIAGLADRLARVTDARRPPEDVADLAVALALRGVLHPAPTRDRPARRSVGHSR